MVALQATPNLVSLSKILIEGVEKDSKKSSEIQAKPRVPCGELREEAPG